MKTYEHVCKNCGDSFSNKKRVGQFCGHSCVGKYFFNNPEMRAVQRKACTRQGTYTCLSCEKEFSTQLHDALQRKFCSKACVYAYYKGRPSNVSEEGKSRQLLALRSYKQTPEQRLASSLRMKDHHPTSKPGVSEKISNSLKGRTFLSRGGNGAITKQQLALQSLLRLGDESLEYPILTAPVAGGFMSLPPAYKVDIGIPEIKLAIEVDGRSHIAKRQRWIDHRKTEVLKALGWSVIRFWNREIDDDPRGVIKRIIAWVDSETGKSPSGLDLNGLLAAMKAL